VSDVRRVSFDEMQCSIAQSLEVVGEWWTPLIIREVSLGRRRFEEMQEDLGISRNVLTDRLNKLVEEEVLFRENIAQSGTRHEYRLTEKGHDLFPLLVALLRWGDKWMPNRRGPHTELVHTTCGHVTHPVLTCSHCGEPVTDADVRARPGKQFRDDPDHPLVKRALAAR
jgi:DNA-binding HxlR family transcriptional regulator